ncbi:MAG: MFS transporter [Burkholderiales bacterium]|nr:MFS transporter [Burkholderiales bacterium]
MSTATPRGALLRDRNLRWLFVGALISQLGDQFTLIALPWAVLRMTNDPLVLGTVLAVMGIPRAAFILIGGAFVDRHSPQRVLMVTKLVNTALLALLAVGVGTGTLTLWMMYALALGIGLATAFSIPAASSMLPQVVAPAQLPAANGLMMSMRQLSLLLGPMMAGLLIAFSGGDPAQGGNDALGVALAFGLDALSFAVSAWTLAKVVTRPAPAPARQAVLSAVAEGLRSFWADRELRALLGYGAVVSLFIAGPVHTAMPVLAKSMPALGAAGLGTMLAAHGAGTLIGLAAAGLRPHWRIGTLGMTVLTIDGLVGLLFMPMGHISAVWQGAALLLAIGTMSGFMQVMVFSWLQRRVAPAMMGRAMSLFMFVFVGLAPLSAVAAGALLRVVSLASLFTGAGVLLVAVVLAAMTTSMRQMGSTQPTPAT